LFDEGSAIEWIPCGKKIICSSPGLKFKSGPEEYYGNAVQVLEMDGNFDQLAEMVYIESQMSNTSTKFYGELATSMLQLADAPGSNNGTGLMQTLAAFAIRELYQKKTQETKV
jgi:phosphoribulokinase